jgi:hypothetical protein
MPFGDERMIIVVSNSAFIHRFLDDVVKLHDTIGKLFD